MNIAQLKMFMSRPLGEQCCHGVRVTQSVLKPFLCLMKLQLVFGYIFDNVRVVHRLALRGFTDLWRAGVLLTGVHPHTARINSNGD